MPGATWQRITEGGAESMPIVQELRTVSVNGLAKGCSGGVVHGHQEALVLGFFRCAAAVSTPASQQRICPKVDKRLVANAPAPAAKPHKLPVMRLTDVSRVARIAFHGGLAGVLAIVLMAIPTSTALACQCRQPAPSTAERYESATTVFIGTVVEATEVDETRIRFTFTAERSLKGAIKPQMNVVTNRGEAACGAGFAIGERWLVFGSSYCDGNRLFNGAPAQDEARLARLGLPAGTAVTSSGSGLPSTAVSGTRLGFPSIPLIVTGTLLVGSSAYVVARRRRAPAR